MTTEYRRSSAATVADIQAGIAQRLRTKYFRVGRCYGVKFGNVKAYYGTSAQAGADVVYAVMRYQPAQEGK